MSEAVYRTVIAAGKVALRALDLQVRTHGVDRVPSTGPVVLASNHVSFPDFVLVGQAMLGSRRLTRFLCRHDIWDTPARWPVGWAMDAMRHVPVNREVPAHAYLRARSLLRQGEVVCVFPEGGISAAYVVRALMPGAVALAREVGAPLVPISMWGGQRLWAQKRTAEAPVPPPTFTRGRVVDVRFGEPIDVPPDADLVATTRRLGEVLHAGVEELQLLPEHRPRPGEYAPWFPAHLGGAGLDRAESFVLDAMPRTAVVPTWGPRG